MNLSVFIRLVTCLVVFFSASTSAFEFQVKGGSGSVKIRGIDTSEPYEILDKITAPSFVKGLIGHNQQVGSLHFRVAAKKRSKIRVEYDNNDLLFSRLSGDEIAIDAPGKLVALSFNVFSPASGHIKIYNEKNRLLKTIAYSVLKERRYRQRLSGNIANSNLNKSSNASLSYSVSKKTVHFGDPLWSLNSSVSTDVDDVDDRTVNVGFSYSW